MLKSDSIDCLFSWTKITFSCFFVYFDYFFFLLYFGHYDSVVFWWILIFLLQQAVNLTEVKTPKCFSCVGNRWNLCSDLFDLSGLLENCLMQAQFTSQVTMWWVYKQNVELPCESVISLLTFQLLCGMCAKWLQSCLTLCDHMDCNLPGSSVHANLQARTLEWVAIPSSRGSSRPSDWTHLSRWVLYH